MRDDVHRRAPVPRRWKVLLKAFRNEASSRSEGDAAAECALKQELRTGLPPSFRSAIVAATRGSQPTLTAAHDLADSARGAPLALAVAATLAIRRPTGAVTVLQVEEAVCASVRASAAAHVRELDGYLAVEAPGERRIVIDRVQKALDKVDLTVSANAIARGEEVVVRRSSRKALAVDDDIR